MKNILLTLFVLVAAGLFSGCASTGFLKAYPGPERPADQLATIVLPASIEVRSINGAQQPNITGTLLKKEYTIATLPGPQDWSIRYNAPLAGGYYDQRNEVTESPWLPFQFQAESGGAYRLHVETPRENAKLQYEQDKVRFSMTAEQKAGSGQPSTRSQLKPVESAPALVVPPPPPQAKANAPQTLENAAFEQLKSWWNVAGAHERQAFRDWLKAQP
ncbi:MAG: hypothetical protein NTY53_26195 [Kiritimatiellaeota bacterium]|nr:hypothetical protein [Kiritimatiellota bacterium]